MKPLSREEFEHAERVEVIANLPGDLRIELQRRSLQATARQNRSEVELLRAVRLAKTVDALDHRALHIPDVVDLNGKQYRGKALEPNKAGHQIADADGAPGAPYRVVDTLEVLFRNGTISESQRNAGRQFRDEFSRAHLDGHRSVDWLSGGGGAATGSEAESIIRARRKVERALDNLGGSGGILGSCAWHIVGRENSVREWCDRQVTGGRGMDRRQATGILIAVLAVLDLLYKGR
jgi:hypothetical protein